MLRGFYLVGFEQNGSGCAEYGVKLLENLAKNINIKGLPAPELSRCRQVYHTSLQIFGLIIKEFKNWFLPISLKILLFQISKNQFLGRQPKNYKTIIEKTI
ncbi:hypothetical protein FM107_19380 [Sphingobacterium sp. JB170]|nr:hypothetical protein FM107_19380 [Sphingobacterium sp. JB170]